MVNNDAGEDRHVAERQGTAVTARPAQRSPRNHSTHPQCSAQSDIALRPRVPPGGSPPPHSRDGSLADSLSKWRTIPPICALLDNTGPASAPLLVLAAVE